MNKETLASYIDATIVKNNNTFEDVDALIKAAKEYLEGDDTVFFAVGLAHLLGETGLVDALREAGYTVELVEYK